MASFQTPPIWASLPYTQLQLAYTAPVLAYHRYQAEPRTPHLVRGLFTLGVGLAGVLGMVLYEMGHNKTAFIWSISTATIGAFVAAARVTAAYAPQAPEPTISDILG